jgi:small subunit ribosomal protein S15
VVTQKENKTNIIKEFGQNPKDTGSAGVQVALLTKAIDQLTNHCQVNAHDHSSKRGLLKKVCQRRKLLSYLERTDEAAYKAVIGKLGLRK